ncbi:dTDP-4-amino-4,6-dideoxygalactose transaminase [Halobacteriovorax sp. DPLXC-1]|uniref:dTDP-4-amino-4,6-dideoxygalactose transaminase n=1 Tax=Halobacteriovorax sp. DPLXC-1 TaxID=3110771 RepID=UPI002FF3F61D
MKIPFNKSTVVGNELEYIKDAIDRSHISGNGYYSKKCVNFFQEKYGFGKCLLTTSCTDALEMSAVLLDLKPGDEVIVPAFTFVSTANAYTLHGGKVVFADSKDNNPNICPKSIRSKITKNTRAICIVHYAGYACDMDEILEICKEHNLVLIEDAAQAIDSFYKGRALGSFGDFATFSFHETKNISSGEGGMLVVNNSEFYDRSEIIWEKGTNRAAFKRGDVQKYECVDVGASYLLSELNAAYLWGQVEKLEVVTAKRKEIWDYYYNEVFKLGYFNLPEKEEGKDYNGHLFFLTIDSNKRSELISNLADQDISTSFHYLSLESSPYYNAGKSCTNAIRFEKEILRLPIYYSMRIEDYKKVIDCLSK